MTDLLNFVKSQLFCFHLSAVMNCNAEEEWLLDIGPGYALDQVALFLIASMRWNEVC
jgi:hypothetical protein